MRKKPRSERAWRGAGARNGTKSHAVKECGVVKVGEKCPKCHATINSTKG